MEKIFFFKTQSELRTWFITHHESLNEAWIGFYKRDSGKQSITWPESVEEALCFGWIDGVRKSIDENRYKIRFTPRKKESIWSQINLRKMEELIAKKLLYPAGLKAYSERNAEKVKRYSFEQENHTLDSASEKKFKTKRKAWENFSAMPPSYRKPAIWWVISAKREETRKSRLEILISCSQQNERIPMLRRTK